MGMEDVNKSDDFTIFSNTKTCRADVGPDFIEFHTDSDFKFHCILDSLILNDFQIFFCFSVFSFFMDRNIGNSGIRNIRFLSLRNIQKMRFCGQFPFNFDEKRIGTKLVVDRKDKI